MSDLDLLLARATTAGISRAYKLGAVPSSPVYPYAVLGLDTGTPVSTRVGGDSPDLRYLLTVQMFGKVDDSVRAMATAADVAFKDATLTQLDRDPFCWRVLSTPITRDPDTGGVLYALHTYRY
jgi:hypothetical protein